MASKWMKSLQCKSKVLDDVVNHHNSNPRNHRHSLSNSSSCKNGIQSLKDIVEITKQSKPRKPKPPKIPQTQTPPSKRPVLRKPETGLNLQPAIRTRSGSAESFFPSLTELPEGHPSRNVVEIIFHTSWGEKHFSGRVEMVFKVLNLNRTVSRFDEYREVVKSRARSTAASDSGEDHARCVADGNEMMRFYCLGATASSGAYDAAGSDMWAFHGGKGAPVCTFSGSGRAHDNGGGGRGRRAMLVCRVIAGRVCKQLHFDSLIDRRAGFDSVSGENGELIVFDPRAVLPCFLIIYKL